VRNNIFHGSKTRIEMSDPGQQLRLLVYTAVLITMDAVFFEAAKRTDLGWRAVPMSFEEKLV
jgi:hypothetical protein